MLHEPKIWNEDRRIGGFDCIVHIYEAIKRLEFSDSFSIVDIAGGSGLILDAITRLFPGTSATLVDARTYSTWRRIKADIKKIEMPLQTFIASDDNQYDIVMMLDMYRMWGDGDPVKIALDEWILSHAKYFLTSAAKLPYEKMLINGYDLGKGGSDKEEYPLELYKLPLAH